MGSRGPTSGPSLPTSSPEDPGQEAVERSAKTNVRHPARDTRKKGMMSIKFLNSCFSVCKLTGLETWLSYCCNTLRLGWGDARITRSRSYIEMLTAELLAACWSSFLSCRTLRRDWSIGEIFCHLSLHWIIYFRQLWPMFRIDAVGEFPVAISSC